MRDRLIELFREMDKTPEITCPNPTADGEACKGCKYAISEWLCDMEARKADYLLANGVIVPPVRVGQTVYIIDDEVDYGDEYVLDVTVDAVGRDRGGVWVTLDLPLGFKRSAYVGAFEIGKTIFLTEEEAEQALKEREKV